MPSPPGGSSFGGYTPERAEHISRSVDWLMNGTGPDGKGRPDDTSLPGNARWVRLLEPLAKATNSLTGQAEAEFRFMTDALNVNNRDIEESDSSDPDGVVVNRSTDYEAGLNEIILVIPIEGTEDEWAPVAASASGPTLVTGSCDCSCIEDGDIVVDTHTTTSQWAVSLAEIIVQETHGRVILPANEHLLTWNSGAGYWQKNIGSELLGEYNDDSPYTFPSTPSPAYIRFDNNDSGYMTLKIVWPDDLIPAP